MTEPDGGARISGTPSVGIVGGGALGLAAALRLVEAGIRVTVIERETELGGLAAGFSPAGHAGATLEKFYHHLFKTDRTALRFINGLGLGQRLLWRQPLTTTLYGGRIHPMTPLGLLRFAPIPWTDRLRFMSMMALLKLTPNERRFAGKTAAAWSKTWAGPRAYDALIGPLLAGKFGARADEIAMSWFWSRFHERSLSLGYLRGGFQQLYDALGQRIRSLGGTILLSTAATSIASDASGGGRVRVETDREAMTFDRLLVTTPQRLFNRLARDLPQPYLQRYTGPDFYSAHVLILALDRPLTSSYWINVADAGFPFLVLVEHTNFLPPTDYGGQHLVYLGNYLPPDAAVFGQAEDEILAAYLPALRRINPRFDRSWLRAHWIFQAPYAQPIVTSTYLDTLSPHQTPLPGVYLATMAHVYPQDRGQNYSLSLGERMAALIRGGLASPPAPLQFRWRGEKTPR